MSPTLHHWVKRARESLGRPIDASSMIFFRICFGLCLFVEACRYVANGWVRTSYSAETLHFPFYGFEWIKPLSASSMELVFLALGVCGLFLAVGFLYRLSSLALTALLFYTFMIDKANYLNHIYLITLIAFLLSTMPLNRWISIDNLLFRRSPVRTIPAWCLWLILIQLGIVYTYAGIAKIKYDWLIAAEPMTSWLIPHKDWPVIGWLFVTPGVPHFLSWSGMLLDLFIFPLLLWRRTRPFAVGALVLFHIMNANLFNIGIFPWVMLAATGLFLDPGWVRRLIYKLRRRPAPPLPPHKTSKPLNPWIWRFMCGYILLQLLLPFRHHLYPGDVNWTKEGSRFSWRMKLNRRSGDMTIYYVSDQQPRPVLVPLHQILTPKQIRKMRVWPDILHDFAHILKKNLELVGQSGVQVFVDCKLSLNGREMQLFIDPEVNIAAYPRSNPFTYQPWIVPLKGR